MGFKSLGIFIIIFSAVIMVSVEIRSPPFSTERPNYANLIFCKYYVAANICNHLDKVLHFMPREPVLQISDKWENAIDLI
jgi:hypothetical protein